jgi:hypothetical protein
MTSELETYAKKGLESELVRLDQERERVMSLLAGLGRKSGRAVAPQAADAKRPRQMSDAGRQAIREAVKRRWERVRAEKAGAATKAGAAKGEATVPVASRKRTRKATRTGSRKK